jgi:hypothetical protein
VYEVAAYPELADKVVAVRAVLGGLVRGDM